MSDKLSYLAKYGGDFSTTETTSKKKKKKDKKKKSKKRNDETNTNTSTTLVRDLDDDDAAFHHDETNDDDLGEEGPIICLPDGTTSSSIDYKTLQSKSKQQHAPKSGFVPVKDENENENENVNNTRKDRRMKRYDSEEEEQNNSMDSSPPRNRRSKQRHDSEDEDQNSAHKSPPRNRQRKRYDSEEDDDDDDKYERGNNYNRSSPPRNRQRKRHDSEDDDDNSDIDSRRRQRQRQRKSRKEKESMSSPRKKYRTRHDTDSEEDDTHGHRDHHRHHRRRHRRSPSHSRSRSRSNSPVRQHPRRQQRHDSSSEEEEDNDQHIGGKDMSNAIASTTYRDSKTGQKMDMKRQYQDVLSEHRKEQLKAIELNKGKAQKEQEQQMKQIQNFVKAQPFARTEDDLDFETGKKHEIRAEDPMAMQAMKRQQQNSNGKSSKPTYKGPAPKPNRFNIKPGYRWDGVDRGNGFEDKVLALTYSQAQRKENAYKWSTADM